MEQNPVARRFKFYSGLAMILIYAIMGLLFLFVIRFDFIPKVNTMAIGCIILIYAVYRVYKLNKETKALKEDINTDVEQ